MPFSTQICITNTGTGSLFGLVKIASNLGDPNYNNPIYIEENVPISSLTGANCPYILNNVPDGTTEIRIQDKSGCSVRITIASNNVCNTCQLDITNVSGGTSAIIASGLTGTCDSTITDYSITWYGPNSSTNVAFTSGAGTLFPYNVPHPITQNTSPLLLPGVYTSRITHVELNGVKFSYTGGTNQVESSSLTSCTENATVTSYTCSSQTNPNYNGTTDLYKNSISYTAQGVAGEIPDALSGGFTIDPSTTHFAWSFYAFSIFDTLKLTYSGSAYPQPLVLEQLTLGDITGSTDFSPTTWPKLYDSTSTFKKITTLTGLTRNVNDLIIMDVTPNPSSPGTSWQFKFGCASPTGSKTCLDTYQNSPYKIQLSSLVPTATTCNLFSLTLNVSGCSVSDNSGFFDSSLYKLTEGSNSSISTNNATKLLNLSFGPLGTTTQISSGGPVLNSVCKDSVGDVIQVTKSSTAGFDFFFENLAHLTELKNSFDAAKSAISGYSGNYVNDPTQLPYYKYIDFKIPTIAFTGNSICSDNTTTDNFKLHYSTTITTGTTVGGYTAFITSPLVSNQFVCPGGSCYGGCPSSIDNFINSCINTRNTTFPTRTFNNGLRYDGPFYNTDGNFSSTTTNDTSSLQSGTISINPNYSTKTYVASGGTNNTSTLIPSLSGESWDWANHFYTNNPTGSNPTYSQTVFAYYVVLTSPPPSYTYEIWAYPISNFTTTTAIKIYDSTNPGGYNPTYFY
jgi:hypothetical protein